MLQRLKNLLGGRAVPPAIDGPELAAASLLVEAAMIDGHFDTIERHAVEAGLQRCFPLEAGQVAVLVDRAVLRVGAAADFHGYSRQLRDRLDYAEKERLIEALWRVADADGHKHDYEANLLRRIAGLLGVEDRDAGTARRRARDLT